MIGGAYLPLSIFTIVMVDRQSTITIIETRIVTTNFNMINITFRDKIHFLSMEYLVGHNHLSWNITRHRNMSFHSGGRPGPRW